MKILVGCEFSGTVRDAFAALGHDAWSCDLLPTEKPGNHLQCDVLEILDQGWDLGIFHPPCTFLTCSAEWAYKDEQAKNIKPGTLIGAARRQARDEAVKFVWRLLESKIPRIAIENPVGVLSTRIRKPDQIIQPWQFGHDASKSTCLWLKNLPKLELDQSQFFPPRIVERNGKRFERWGNQTDSGQNRLGPSDDRWALRSVTYEGIAKAMARAWGSFAAAIVAASTTSVGFYR